ncbi:MAG: patatin-like phospholipase family protein [Deferrisomatales bacterium]|nr:patatin-like phospholipase family protein [Deferrisomatales bacterium]
MGETATTPKPINLALQGGGSHGAFTWGVLDRLLEDDRVVIEGISGTSAGAINAAVLADGMEKGGRAGARDALERFWRAMSERGAFSPYRSGPFTPFHPFGTRWSPLALWYEWISQWASPYQLNPFDLNPLREVLAQTIDFARLRACRCVKLYISATNVRTNRLHIFTREQLSAAHLLASACIPTLFQAVTIDGEHYWDGGLMGNPVLEPLVSHCRAVDIVIVQVNPTLRRELPQTAQDIAERFNQIAFNASLMREVRTLAEIGRLVKAGVLQDPRYECTFLHRIAAEEALEGLGPHSKHDTEWTFLTGLRDRGREKAGQWLAEELPQVGVRSTLDLEAWKPTVGDEEDRLYCRV